MTEVADEASTAVGTTVDEQARQEAAGGAPVDLDALAERVFALLKRELWIERERTGRWRAE